MELTQYDEGVIVSTPGGGGPDPIDVLVGRNLRRSRKACRMTQSELAAEVGLTFQQIQKYERGSNRISASKLCRMAAALEVSVSSLLPDNSASVAEEPARDLLGVTDLDDLVADFARLPPHQQRCVRSLIHQLASEDAGPATAYAA